MATFAATVERLTIEEHPNADALELAVVGDYRAIVRKDQFKTGDIGVYIPEQSLVPDWLIKRLGLEGRLAGKNANRVKAIKLRGVLSQGLVVPCPTQIELDWAVADASPGSGLLQLENETDFQEVNVGDDVTEMLGIKKWEPEIPASMSGDVYNPYFQFKYDIENIKRFPNVLEEGEEVVMTEKIHGTLCMLCYVPLLEQDTTLHYDGKWIVASKGLAAQGIALKPTEQNIEKNTYFRALRDNDVFEKVENIISLEDRVIVLGEVYGRGVQDLRYGNETNKFGFRIFDVWIDDGDDYLNHDLLEQFCLDAELEMVPVLYKGPFSQDVLDEHTNGKETISGMEAHVREGVVIKPLEERTNNEIGRVILKSVSESYLLRKNGTEYN